MSPNPVPSAVKQPGSNLGSICCHFPHPLSAPQHPQVSVMVITVVVVVVVVIGIVIVIVIVIS